MLLRYKELLLLTLILMGSNVYSQNDPFSTGRQHKNHFFVYWGYNRDAYSKSNIHFKGPEYDFTLMDVKAKDQQEKLTFNKYFKLNHITIPQYNYRLGFWIKNNLSVSVGLDHMKYVVVQDQTVDAKGHIYPRGNYTEHTDFKDGDEVKLTKDFLKFEHTDGLNYLSAEVDYLPITWMIIPEKIEVSPVVNAGLGMYIPKTDVTLFGYRMDNKFHVAGWGASVMAGIHIEFWRILFFRAGFKMGYANLPDVLTTGESYDRANHQFAFYQGYGVLGANFILFKSKDQNIKKKL